MAMVGMESSGLVDAVDYKIMRILLLELLGSSNGSASLPADPAPTAEVSSTPVMGHPPLLRTHPMQTRAKSGIFKPNHRSYLSHVPNSGLLHSLLTMREPKGCLK
ncbi:hypothetical protein F0562_006317 [Nyssa sinensis]|uniref:Uncharacterized protein n=1 Tax=Nyssa sinensis TaxID=561372 RepID=A0A5J5AN17_9ASTE|nr:hypothetical protein F0562_006317 [Nyssa sinensis]